MQKRIWNAFGVILKAATFLTLLLIVIASLKVNDVLHPPPEIAEGKTLRKFDIPYQEVELITDDGIHLSAWYTPPRNGALILLAHGYGHKRPEWVYEILARTGYGVLAWDARAHGRSGGEISTVGYLEVLDVKSALEYAQVQPGVRRVGAWGASMGAATLIRAAAEYPQIEALFVDSSFASLDDELDYLIPWPFVNPLAKYLAEAETGLDLDAVSPLDVIARISPRPVYIVHSRGDRVAPPGAGLDLFNAAREPRFLWLDDHAPHLQVYLENPARYKRRLIDFWLLGT